MAETQGRTERDTEFISPGAATLEKRALTCPRMETIQNAHIDLVGKHNGMSALQSITQQ